MTKREMINLLESSNLPDDTEVRIEVDHEYYDYVDEGIKSVSDYKNAFIYIHSKGAYD